MNTGMLVPSRQLFFILMGTGEAEVVPEGSDGESFGSLKFNKYY